MTILCAYEQIAPYCLDFHIVSFTKEKSQALNLKKFPHRSGPAPLQATLPHYITTFKSKDKPPNLLSEPDTPMKYFHWTHQRLGRSVINSGIELVNVNGGEGNEDEE